jgi:hypothetical protein
VGGGLVDGKREGKKREDGQLTLFLSICVFVKIRKIPEKSPEKAVFRRKKLRSLV